MNDTPHVAPSLQAAVYARISLDRSGQALGVERQVTDCKAKAHALGWAVAGQYIDNDVSASGNKPRPEYERLKRDLETGRVKAVVVYDLDRLTRKPAELEEFISIADRLQISLANVSGDVDLTTASGRMVARIKGAVARQEAERIAERVSRQKQQRAEQGMPQGGRERLYGYSKDWTVIEAEAQVVREMFQRRAAGESTTAIASDLESRGILTAAGKPWRSGTLARTLTKAWYAGLREFKGEIVGPTAYPALVDESLFYVVQARLKNSSMGTNARKHLLSGFLICRECGTPMKGAVASQRAARYRCASNYGGCGKTSIRRDWVDVPIKHLVLDRVRHADNTEPPEVDRGEELQRVSREIKATQDLVRSGQLGIVMAAPILTDLADQQARLRDLTEQGENPAPWRRIEHLAWWNMNVSQRRALLARYVEKLYVDPSPTVGRNSIDLSRLEVVYVDGSRERLSNDLLDLLEEPES